MMKVNINRNRNMIIFAICLLFACIGNVTSQIIVPPPSIHLAFDTDDAGYESVSKTSGVCTGPVERGSDRFGQELRSVQFKGDGAGVRFDASNINAVHTVSLWIYVGDPSDIPAGSVPFSPTDTESQFYNWTDRANNILKGLGRKKATVGFNRYIVKPGGGIVPWYLWSYKPAEFNLEGWYHIFVVHGMYYTRLIMYKPGGYKAYSYIWMGDQGFPTNRYLYIGGYPGHYSASYFDDFKVYNVELTDDQIDFVHTAEYPDNGYARIKNLNSGKYAVVKNGDPYDQTPIIQYSNGAGNDEWKFRFTGRFEGKIENLHTGKVMVVKGESMAEEAEIVQNKETGTNSEVWALEYGDASVNAFRLRNKKSGKYLGVYQNSKEEGAKLVQLYRVDNIECNFINTFPNAKSKMETGLYRLKNKRSGMYMTVLDKSTKNIADIVQHSKLTKGNEPGFDTWFIAPSPDGQNAYTIQNAVSKYRVSGYSYEPIGVNLFQTFREEGQTNWQFIPTGAQGEFRIRNADTYFYAVVKDASTAENANVIQYTAGTGDNEIWTLEKVYFSDPPLAFGAYKVRNLNSKKLMVVKGASKEDDAEVIQYSTGEENSVWEVLPADFGYVQLRNLNSKKYLVVKNASMEIGDSLIQHEADTPNSYWKIDKVFYTESDTTYTAYTLKNKLSELYAVVKDASTEDEAPIIQYNTGEKNKLWLFSGTPSPRSLEEKNDNDK